MDEKYGKFSAGRTGHTRNARKLLLDEGLQTLEEVAYLGGEAIDALISKHFIAVVLQEDALNYDEIYLIPRKKWDEMAIKTISRY